MQVLMYVIGFAAIAAVISLGFRGVSGYWPWQWEEFRKSDYKHK